MRLEDLKEKVWGREDAQDKGCGGGGLRILTPTPSENVKKLSERRRRKDVNI